MTALHDSLEAHVGADQDPAAFRAALAWLTNRQPSCLTVS